MMLINDQYPTQKTLQSCLRIRFGESSGTAFLVNHGSQQFMVTAAHVLNGIQPGDKFAFFFNSKWWLTRFQKIRFCDEKTDVCALIADDQFHKFWSNQGFELSEIGGNFAIGERVYYLGFPLGYSTDLSADLDKSDLIAEYQENLIHLPFLKSGMVSGLKTHDWGPEIFIETISNAGFSGGPLICRSIAVEGIPELKVVGLMSSYKFDTRQFLHQILPNGEVERLNHQFISPNSGFSVAIGAKRILNLIENFEN
jgi:hypothetical protein